MRWAAARARKKGLNPSLPPYLSRRELQKAVAETVKAKSLTVDSAARCCANNAIR